MLSAFKGKTVDFTAFPRQNKSQILTTDLVVNSKIKTKKEKKKVNFSIGEKMSIKDIMSSQSTGRRRMNFNEQ